MFGDNTLIKQASEGRLRLPGFLSAGSHRFVDRIIYPLVTIAFAFLVPWLSILVTLPYWILVSINPGSGSYPAEMEALWQEIGLLLAAFSPYFLLVWAWLRLFERRSLTTVGLNRPNWQRRYLRGLVLGLLLFAGAITLIALFGSVRNDGEGMNRLISTSGALLIFLGWAVQGGAEELLHRGLVLPIVGTRFGTIAGILISSLLFALLHLFNANLTLLAVVNLLLFGILTALYALYEESLWGVFAIHAVWNWTEGNLLGLPVSGSLVSQQTIFRLTLVGPEQLTGGAFGPEGSLSITVVLIVASLILLAAHRRRSRMTRQ